jgi:hypothetical protein
MSTTNRPLTCLFWCPRPKASVLEGILSATEQILQTEPLEFEIADDGHPQVVAQRGDRMLQLLSDAGWALLCNGREHHLVSVTIRELFTGQSTSNSLFQLSVDLATGWNHEQRIFELVGTLGPLCAAYRGCTTLVQTGARTMDEYLCEFPDPAPPPHVPITPCWIAYWSAATVHALAVGHDDPRIGLFHHVEHRSDGSLVLQLTPDPLDLDVPHHRYAIESIYAAFPEIPRRIPT